VQCIDQKNEINIKGLNRARQRKMPTQNASSARRETAHSNTYSLLSLPLVGFHLHLQFVHQILESKNVLAIFLRLKQLVSRKDIEIIFPIPQNDISSWTS